MKRFTKFAALIIALSSAVILTGADVSFGAFSNENNPIVPIVRRTSIAVVNIDVETIAKRSNIGFPFDDDPILIFRRRVQKFYSFSTYERARLRFYSNKGRKNFN